MEQDALLASSQQAKLPLALFIFESNKKKQLLFDPSTKKIRGIISVAFADATCVFENGGWLLMLQHKQHGFQEQQEQTIFLVHASTGRRLELPACPSVIDGLFVFYVGSSEVPLVVVCIETISGVPTVYVACPGDIYWSVYKNIEDGSHLPLDPHRRIKCTLIIDAVLLGKQAVCVDYHGKILIFDVTEMSWRRTALSKGWNERDAHFLVASSEEVVLISCRRFRGRFCDFKFFKLDAEALEWSPLDDTELDGCSWFLYRGRSILAREEGKRKVYTFYPSQWGGSTPIDADSSRKRKVAHMKSLSSREKSVTNIFMHDLEDGVVRTVLPASIVTEERHWLRSSVFGGPFQ
ncbi:hypothetical protein CFC21_104301 [Triticum aestivum]|uniref:KIB1-4 beta-propeller domain-containing protein n=2 Tax=Triticum aestivum TaxID=4565 RepID=A0A9R1N7C0_WHEAT|nr:uncharacterized protein LOC123159894 [Triticum aestivum]KAF7103300.1 hypothetical protein CFC21_104301 [Triticum aestivum]